MTAEEVQTVYRELTEEKKQAFDHCLDLGDMEAADAILVEHERGKEVEHEGGNEISGK